MSNLIEIDNLAAAVKKVQTARAEGAGPPCNTAVILHLYYPDLWDEISGYLANLGSDFDLYVSVCDTADDSTVANIKQHYPGAFVCKLENQGRDIGPFMEIYPVIAEHYRYICKIHSKKSLHISGGDVWRRELFSKLLGSPKRVAEIKALFDCFPDIGIVGPEGYLLRCQNCLGTNAAKIVNLAQKMGAHETGEFDYDFSTGSMFWFKPEAFTPLLSLNINQYSFEKERGQIDGTLAHAVERIFPQAATVAGYEMVGTHVLGIVKEYFGADWCHNRHYLEAFRDSSILLRKLTKCINALAERGREINMLHNSISWKVTAPLRRANSLLSRLIGKKQ